MPLQIQGCEYWNDSSFFCVQTNDPVEKLYRNLIDEIRIKYPEVNWGYLESCGANALANCLGATRRGREIIKNLEMTPGGYKQQVSHLFMGWLNDPANYQAMRDARQASGAGAIDPEIIQGNRVPQFYTALCAGMLGITARFEWGCTYDNVRDSVRIGNPVQICLVNPSHYLAVKAWDEVKDVLLYDDSWPQRTGGTGFSLELKKSDFSNVSAWRLVYKII